MFGFLFGNWGLFDAIEALKWIQHNGECFNGDVNNVTIFGQSSGGWSVEALMMSPLSGGLFHRAIAQSGSLKTQFMKFGRVEENPTYKFLEKKYEKNSTEDLREHLRKFSVDELNKL